MNGGMRVVARDVFRDDSHTKDTHIRLNLSLSLSVSLEIEFDSEKHTLSGEDESSAFHMH